CIRRAIEHKQCQVFFQVEMDRDNDHLPGSYLHRCNVYPCTFYRTLNARKQEDTCNSHIVPDTGHQPYPYSTNSHTRGHSHTPTSSPLLPPPPHPIPPVAPPPPPHPPSNAPPTPNPHAEPPTP